MLMLLMLLLVVYITVSIVQFVAIVQGLAAGLGCGCFSLPLALIAAGCPVLGPILGVIGAHKAWGWSYLRAIGLFLIPYLLGFPVILIAV